MSIDKQTLFWLGAAAVLVALLVLLGDILLPFVLGAAIAYFLDPLADRLEEFGLSRLLATILIVSIFVLLLILGLVIVVPLLVSQLMELVARLPDYFQSMRDFSLANLARWFDDSWITRNLELDGTVGNLAEKLPGTVGQVISSVWSGGLAIVNFIALLVITPVVAFYLLLDWDRMIARISEWLPRDHAETVRGLAGEINEVMSGFVRGQVTVLLILSLLYVAGLTLIGLNFGLLIGLGAGLISFIPFVGPAVGFVVGGLVAVFQFWPEWHLVVAVLGVFMAGQAVEGNVLSPMIVGDRVRLHPLWLIFALFAFGYWFGFVGLLLAVPLAAAIGVLVRFALRSYLDSSLYRGQGEGARDKKSRVRRAP